MSTENEKRERRFDAWWSAEGWTVTAGRDGADLAELRDVAREVWMMIDKRKGQGCVSMWR